MPKNSRLRRVAVTIHRVVMGGVIESRPPLIGGVIESIPPPIGGVIESAPPPIGGVIESGLIPYHLLVTPPLVIINERPLKIIMCSRDGPGVTLKKFHGDTSLL